MQIVISHSKVKIPPAQNRQPAKHLFRLGVILGTHLEKRAAKVQKGLGFLGHKSPSNQWLVRKQIWLIISQLLDLQACLALNGFDAPRRGVDYETPILSRLMHILACFFVSHGAVCNLLASVDVDHSEAQMGMLQA